MEITVNGKRSLAAPITVIVAPLQPIPNLPNGYIEHSRWTDGTGTTTIRCWPADMSTTRLVPEPFVRDPEAWQAVAAEGRKYR